ncbi:MAG: hypothetical protein ACM35G_04660 [Planctomycetaceae bacterium]
MRSLTACLGHHPLATLQTGKAGWSRHQPASKVAVPADIHGGDAVAENYPSELSDALAVRIKELLGHRHVTTTQIYDKRRRSLKEGASHDVPI